MFGCIGKIVVLAVLIVVGAAAWLTRGIWEPRVREKLGMKPAITAAASAPAWEPVTTAGAARARRAIETLKRPTGPSFVNVGTGDLVAHGLEPVMKFLGPAAERTRGDTTTVATEALAGENTITIRGSVQLSELGMLDLGPLGSALKGQQRITFRGTPTVSEPGKGSFTVDRIYIGEVMLAGPIVNTILRRMVPQADRSLPPAAIALNLAAEIADIRVTRGRVTLYKAPR